MTTFIDFRYARTLFSALLSPNQSKEAAVCLDPSKDNYIAFQFTPYSYPKKLVDLVKLYATLTPDLMAAGIDEAHRLALPVVAHPMLTTWTEAARLGIDGIVHILGWSAKLLPEAARPAYLAMMGGTQFLYGWLELVEPRGPEMADAIHALAQRGVVLDPTLVVFERAVRVDDLGDVRRQVGGGAADEFENVAVEGCGAHGVTRLRSARRIQPA